MTVSVPLRNLVGAACCLWLGSGCSHDWDLFDPRLDTPSGATASGAGGGATTGATTTSTTSGSGPSSSSSMSTGSASSASTGAGGSGGQGGAGGAPVGALVDDGLLVRYYLDEAASGQLPALALDAAPDPLHLPFTYTPGMTYVEIGGHRGLAWNAAELDGRASIPAADTKLVMQLTSLIEATIEVVVRIDAVSMSNSRISHIGTDSESGRFTLSTNDVDQLKFFWRPGGDAQPIPILAGLWQVGFDTVGRVVLHVVLDTSAPVAADRLRLFVGGALALPLPATPPAAGESIQISNANHFTIGNREIGMRSFQGELYYSAMYTKALSEADVLNNAAVLADSDDSP